MAFGAKPPKVVGIAIGLGKPSKGGMSGSDASADSSTDEASAGGVDSACQAMWNALQDKDYDAFKEASGLWFRAMQRAGGSAKKPENASEE